MIDHIIQPKITNRYRVEFVNFREDDDNILSNQVITFSRPTKYIDGRCFVPGPIFIKFADDIHNKVITAIYSQITLQRAEYGTFTIILHVLDGDGNSYETTKYSGCKIKEITPGELNYAHGDALTITLKIDVCIMERM